MAQITIRERDLTGNPASSVFDVAFVPGLTIEDPEAVDEKGNKIHQWQYNKPYYFDSLSSFQHEMGSYPVLLTGEGVTVTINDEEHTYFGEGELDNGYIYAAELLMRGLPIYYLPIEGDTAQAVYDALEGTPSNNVAEVDEDTVGDATVAEDESDEDQAEVKSVLLQLADRGTFNVKYITSGGYPTFEYNNNNIARTMLMIAGASPDHDINAGPTTDDYEDDPSIPDNGRGDCLALIDHFEVDDRPLTGAGSVWKAVNDAFEGDAFLSFGAMFTPYANYALQKQIMYSVEEDGKKVKKSVGTHYFPASFAYMCCLANQLGGILPSYEAIAGVARGSVRNIVFNSNTNSYEVCTKDVITNYIANHYNSMPNPPIKEVELPISINAITQINPYGMVIWGTRTLMKKDPVDGVKAVGILNIRNMVSDIKKQMYQSARRYMYAANNDALWINFRSSVVGLLNQLIQGYGIKSYSLKKDMAKSTKSSLYVLCSIQPVYPVEHFDITIEITDEDIEVNEA